MMRAEGEALKIVDKHGYAYWDENDKKKPSVAGVVKDVDVVVESKGSATVTIPRGRPEIDRCGVPHTCDNS